MNLTTTPGRNELPWQPLRRLGDASLSGYRIPYPGLNRVVDIAKTWIENYRSEQFVRDKALQITRSISKHPRSNHPDMRNFDAIAKAIHDYIVREIKYVRDQNDVERLQTPDATLLLKAGDCDDMVILGGALLESVGVPTRIKLIGKKTDEFSHIYLEYQSNGQWKSFDPTLALYPGYVFPKNAIKAERTVKIDRDVPNLTPKNEVDLSSGSEFLNDLVQPTKFTNTMESKFIDYSDTELGIDPVTAISTGTSIVNTVSSLFGGKNRCTESKKAKRQEIEDAIRTYLTTSDMRSLVSGMENRVSPNPKDMAYFYMGEEDCYHKGVGSRHQQFLNELPELIAQRAQEAAQEQSAVTAMSTGTMASAGGKKVLLIGGGSALLLGLAALALRNGN